MSWISLTNLRALSGGSPVPVVETTITRGAVSIFRSYCKTKRSGQGLTPHARTWDRAQLKAKPSVCLPLSCISLQLSSSSHYKDACRTTNPVPVQSSCPKQVTAQRKAHFCSAVVGQGVEKVGHVLCPFLHKAPPEPGPITRGFFTVQSFILGKPEERDGQNRLCHSALGQTCHVSSICKANGPG